MEAAGAARQAETEQVTAVTANLQALGTMWPPTHSQQLLQEIALFPLMG